MKQGMEVRVVDPADGKERKAIVLTVLGSGPSNFKILDVQYGADDSMVVKKVPHQNDAKVGEWYWLMKGERRLHVEKVPSADLLSPPAAPDAPAAPVSSTVPKVSTRRVTPPPNEG